MKLVDWVKKHKKKLAIGTVATVAVIGGGVLVAKCLGGSSPEDIPEITPPKRLVEDLPIPEGWKWVTDYWIEPRGDSNARLILTDNVPIDELDTFVSQLKEVYKENVCFVVDGR